MYTTVTLPILNMVWIFVGSTDRYRVLYCRAFWKKTNFIILSSYNCTFARTISIRVNVKKLVIIKTNYTFPGVHAVRSLCYYCSKVVYARVERNTSEIKCFTWSETTAPPAQKVRCQKHKVYITVPNARVHEGIICFYIVRNFTSKSDGNECLELLKL